MKRSSARLNWPVRMMRYLLTEFLKVFGLALAGLVIVITLGNVFDEMNRVFRYDPPPWVAAAFMACKIPKTITEATPLAVLLATLFTLAAKLKSHELIAMRAGGMSQYAMAAPFLGTALLVSLLSVAFNETVVPWANHQRTEIKRVHLLKQPVQPWRAASRVALWTSWDKGDRLVYVEHADSETGLLSDVTIMDFRGLKLVARIDAASAKPVKGAWELRDAQVYRWRHDGLRMYLHRLAAYPVEAVLDDFLHEAKPVDTQTMSDLKQSIERLKKTGREYSKEQVFLYFKGALPFASFIVALLGVGISFNFQTNPREGQAVAMVTAIIAAVCYIGLTDLGQTLGVGGVLPPLIAMWMANVIFLIVGLFLLWRAWRF